MVEILEGPNLLSWRQILDSTEQVVSHVVGNLKNSILLLVDLLHGRVVYFIDRFFLFDEVLHAAQAHMHEGNGILDGLFLVQNLTLSALPALKDPLVILRRVYLLKVSVLFETTLTKSLVVIHAEHVDGQLMLLANCMLLLNCIHVLVH